MKYDVDLQEMDAIRRERNVYVEEMLRVVEENEKKENIAVENREREKEMRRRG